MGVRATCTHITSESNDTIRVDLIGSAYGGSAREVKGAGRNWMRFSHDQLDYANVFSTQVQRGRLEFSFYVQDATDKGVIDDVLATAQGEYTMAYYLNGSLEWIGEVMMDQLGSISVGEPYPYAVTLVARDFVPLEGQLFPLEDNRQLLSTVLGRLLSATGYDLPIWTHTSWTETNINSSNDFLRQLYIETRNLRDFSKDGDLQLTYLQALERIVAPFKAVLKQTGGVFVFDQLSAYETPSSVLRTVYDKDGAFVSQSNVNTTVAANNSVVVVRGSVDEIKPGYKRATVTYAHRTPQGDIPFLSRIAITEANPADVVQSEFVESGKQLSLTGGAGVNYSTPIADAFRPSARIQIQVGSNYWNNALQTWQATPVESSFVMSGNVLDDPLIAQDTFTTNINITTAATPTSGTLTITLKKAFNPTGATSNTVYLDFEFIVLENEENKASNAISYTTEQALSFTQNYNGGTYYFGDGPTIRSAAALRYSTTVTNLTTTWTRRQDSDSFEFHEIALKEIMDHYRGYGRVGSYIIKSGNYSPLSVLTYETRALFYVGGSFDGYTGWWSPIVFQLSLVTGTDQLVVGYVAGPSLITSTTLTAVSLATNNSIEANANYVFKLATQVSGTVTNLSLEPQNIQYPLLKKDTVIRAVHPVTLEQYSFTLAQDMLAGSLTIPVVSTTVTNPLPRGSYIYTNPGDGAAALIIGQDSIRLIAETASVGVTTTESLGPVTSIEVVLNTRVQAGDDLFLVRTLDAEKLAFTVDQTAGPGLVTLQLNQLTTFDAPAGSYIIGSNAKYEGLLQVTPAGVLAKAEAVTTQNSFAILSAPLSAGTYTGIGVTSVRTLKLKSGSVIGLQDKAGNTEFFTVDGDQDLTPATTTIAVVSETTSTPIGAGAGVFQPSWNQTGVLSVQADQIALRVTESQVQAIVDENLGGLLPAENWLFENTDEGFTTNNVTLTNTATYVEYLATGATPYIQKTGLSIDADENPVVTIRVQRIAGTNWGGAFGWTTDGTNYFTQNFVEPSGVDGDFQFATIDLTSNGNYTGTVTGVRLYLGEANLDEFYVDQFTIGKFNPQTEILADLSSRLTVAEGAITVESDRIDLFTQKSQELNRIAEVTGTYNQSSSYTSITLTNIRSGFDIRDNQVLYLVNVDGTFQSVIANGNQNPLASPLAIDSVTFSTTISAGAMLYEAAFTQTSRITQAAGQIVLKAQESAGEVTSLALVRLDASAASGSAVTIQGDLIAINNIEIVRGSGAENGLIRSQGFISGSTGWRIFGDGTAEFNDVTVRGSVFVTGGDAATETYADGVASTALTDALEALSVTIRSATQPTTRPNGDALRAGDIWIDTDDGDAPYSYNGSVFIAAYTSISGGSIKTGTIDADIVTVSAGDGNVTIDNTGISLSSGTFDERRSLVFGTYASGIFLASQTTGNLYIGGTDGNGIYLGSGGDFTNVLSVTFRSSDLRLATANENSTSSTTGTIQVRNGGIGVAGASFFGSTVTVGNATADAHAVNRTTGDSRYARLGSENTFTDDQSFSSDAIFQNGIELVGDGANANLVYAGNNTRTITIPDVDGNRTVAFINQAQTFTAQQSFPHQGIRIENSTSTGFYATLQHTTAGNRTYTFPSTSGTFWNTGNLGLSVTGGAVTPDTTIEIEFGGNRYTIAAQFQP